MRARVVVWLLLLVGMSPPQGVLSGAVSGLQQTPPPPPRDPRAAPGVTGTGVIKGRVVTADSGLPVRRAIVSLNGGPRPRHTYTSQDGGFEFLDLPPATYFVIASPGSHRAAYQTYAYGSAASGPAMSRGKPIPLADGARIEDVLVALPRAGAITGRVTDPVGEPVSRVQVQAMLLRTGVSEPIVGGSVQTDDRGQFRLFGLLPGEYYLRVNPGGASPMEVEGEAVGFASVYAPGTPLLGEATRVRVARGAEASADIQLPETRLFSIAGFATNSKGEPLRSGSVSLVRPDGSNAGIGIAVNQAGSFRVRNVPPGDYELFGRYVPPREPGTLVQGPDPNVEFGSVKVSLGMADIGEILLATRPGDVVTGEIVLDEPVTGGRGAALQAQMVDRRPFVSPPRVEVTDTTFTLRNVFHPVLIRGGIGGPEWGLKAVLLRGRDITDIPTAFSAGDSGHLQVVFTAKAPAVEGVVSDESGKPATEASVILFAHDPDGWRPRSSFLRVATLTGEGGRYVLQGLREGTYFAVAVPPEFTVSVTQPNIEILEELSRVATRLMLNAGEKRTLDLTLVRFEAK